VVAAVVAGAVVGAGWVVAVWRGGRAVALSAATAGVILATGGLGAAGGGSLAVAGATGAGTGAGAGVTGGALSPSPW
jgi:hypothetical protein